MLIAVIAVALVATYELAYGKGSDCGYANGFYNGQAYERPLVLISSETSFNLSPGAELVTPLIPLMGYAGQFYVSNVTVTFFSGTFAVDGNGSPTAEMFVDIGGGRLLGLGYGSTGGLGPKSFVLNLTGEQTMIPEFVIRANPSNNGTATITILDPVVFSLSPSPAPYSSVCLQ